MPYDAAFFEAVDAGSRNAAERLAPALLELVPARSVIDVGGGRGVWLSVLKELGVERVLGVDGAYVDRSRLAIAPEEFIASDLEQPVPVQERFDLAISLETAEHLTKGRAESFVADLCRLAPVVFFSAAIPYQGGTHHINERLQSYWAGLFRQHGYRPADALRKRFWTDLDAGVVYSQNALIYVSEEAMASPALRAAVEATNEEMLDVVHPHVFMTHDPLSNGDQVEFVRYVRAAPFVVRRSLARWYHRQRSKG